MCKSKISRAVVTDANLNYQGSITIDQELMEAADLLAYERVQVLNLHNGARFETYVIAGPAGSGTVCLNGPAARTGLVGDAVTIICYAWMEEEQARRHSPRLVVVDEENRICGPAGARVSGAEVPDP